MSKEDRKVDSICRKRKKIETQDANLQKKIDNLQNQWEAETAKLMDDCEVSPA